MISAANARPFDLKMEYPLTKAISADTLCARISRLSAFLYTVDCYKLSLGSMRGSTRTHVRDIIFGSSTFVVLISNGDALCFCLHNSRYVFKLNVNDAHRVKCVWYYKPLKLYLFASMSLTSDVSTLRLHVCKEVPPVEGNVIEICELLVGFIVRPGYIEFDEICGTILSYEPPIWPHSIGYYRVFYLSMYGINCSSKIISTGIKDMRLSRGHLMVLHTISSDRALKLRIYHLRPNAGKLDKHIRANIVLQTIPDLPLTTQDIVGTCLIVKQMNSSLTLTDLHTFKTTFIDAEFPCEKDSASSLAVDDSQTELLYATSKILIFVSLLHGRHQILRSITPVSRLTIFFDKHLRGWIVPCEATDVTISGYIFISAVTHQSVCLLEEYHNASSGNWFSDGILAIGKHDGTIRFFKLV